ncbi:hypothetical protein NSQ69_06550 [Bacillus sp. FSL R10-2201]
MKALSFKEVELEELNSMPSYFKYVLMGSAATATGVAGVIIIT